MDDLALNIHYVPYQPGFERKVHYRNFVVPEHHPLYGIVSDFYQFDATAPGSQVCVVPDGCIDLLFRFDDDGVTKTPERYHPPKTNLPVHQTGSAFGVRFMPGALTSMIKVQTSELIGRQIPLADLLKRDAALDRMDSTSAFEERIAVVSGYLIHKIKKIYPSADIVKFCTEKIINCQGRVLVGDLSKETGYTVRYLRNLYYQHVGISPKAFCEIIQFQTSLLRFASLLKANKSISLCSLAAEAGYYDQSHMNKCYQRMVGCLPQKFYTEIRTP